MLSCPGLKYWQPFFGEPYRVFVDESFHGLFELSSRGYFSYGIVGVPERSYDQLKALVEPLFREFQSLTSLQAKEFKHCEFRRIPYKSRRNLTFRLRDAFKASGAFLGGFYTPSNAFVMERVRTNLLDSGHVTIPEEHAELLEQARNEILGEGEGPGQAALISRLLHLAVGSVAQMLASNGSKFTIFYDPREKKEDRAVAYKVDWYLSLGQSLNEAAIPYRTNLRDFVLDFVSDEKSEDELGLQLADLFAGEVRDFFSGNQELLQHAATPRLITATSEEPRMTTIEAGGRLLKTGALNPLTPSLQRRFFRQDPAGATVLPILRELFAAGMLTCYSSWGQPRHLMIFEGLVFDQAE